MARETDGTQCVIVAGYNLHCSRLRSPSSRTRPQPSPPQLFCRRRGEYSNGVGGEACWTVTPWKASSRMSVCLQVRMRFQADEAQFH
jgi:hypothetical protein